MHVHVIINPLAAQFHRRPELVQGITRVCGSSARVTATPTLPALGQACAEALADNARLVVLCGGDGTYMAGVSALDRLLGARPWPAISLAPGGSTSTIARNGGRLLRDPVQHIRRLLALAQREPMPTRTCPTLRIREDDGTERVGFIFGTGLVSAFFDAFYAAGGGGPAQAARLVARIVAGTMTGGELARKVLAPMPCTLSIDGMVHPAAAFTLIVSAVVPDLGLHMVVTHRAGEDPKRPHLVASTISVRECGRQYARVLRGRPLLGGRGVDTLAGTFHVGFPQGGGVYVLDGDPMRCAGVTVQGGPVVRLVALPR